MFTKKFLLDLTERSLWTFVQAFAGFLVATKDLSTTTLVAAASAAGIAVVKCLAASKVGDTENASTLPVGAGVEVYAGEPLDAGHEGV